MKAWQDLALHFLFSSLLAGIYFLLSKDEAGSVVIFGNGALLDADHTGRLRQIWDSVISGKTSLKTTAVPSYHICHSWIWLAIEAGVGYFFVCSGQILFGSLLFWSYALHMAIDSLDTENLKLKNNRLPADLHSWFAGKK